MKCPYCGFYKQYTDNSKSTNHNDNDIVFERGNAVVRKSNLASWAKWVGVDNNGSIYEFSEKPTLYEYSRDYDGFDCKIKLIAHVGFTCEDWKELLFEVNNTNTSQLYIIMADMFFNDSWHTVVIDSDIDMSKYEGFAQELEKHKNYRNVKVMLATEIKEE